VLHVVGLKVLSIVENARRNGIAGQKKAWPLHKTVCGKPIRTVMEEHGAFSKELMPIDPSCFYIVCWSDRPGALDFCRTLEQTLYPYGTPANDKFEISYRVWLSNMLWFVICIPIGDAAAAKNIALKCGMRIADGIPKMMHEVDGVKREDWFPIVSGPNVWTLENGRRGVTVTGTLEAEIAEILAKMKSGK
jgi:hypothetical protein